MAVDSPHDVSPSDVCARAATAGLLVIIATKQNPLLHGSCVEPLPDVSQSGRMLPVQPSTTHHSRGGQS